MLAGRDGKKTSSIVLLWSSWKPQLERHLTPNQEAMQLYLSQQHCSRGVLSQFLDAPTNWRWCMSDDEPCQVCSTVHGASRPADVVYTLPRKVGMEFTGPSEVLRQDHMQDEVLDRYEADLEAMVGTCLYCRIEGRRFNHMAGQCFRWINAKKEAYESRKSKSQECNEWIRRYVAYWEC